MNGYLLWWAKLPSLVRYAIGVISVLSIVMLLFLVLLAQLRNAKEEAFEQGKIEVQSEASAVVIERVETAHEIRQEFNLEAARGSSDLVYANCVRSARTPENCQRFLPGRSEDTGRGSSDQGR